MIDQFRWAAADPGLVILEGFHAIKHASRFGAELLTVIHNEVRDLDGLAAEVAPDMHNLVQQAATIDADTFSRIFRHPHPTGIAAIARRPAESSLAGWSTAAPVVLLDGPRHLGNIGATIRISAAAGAAGLISVGEVDPWHPAAVRGSAGLHFALPILQATAIPDTSRPIIAFDPDGEDLGNHAPPNNAILAFGSERTGLSETTKAAAAKLVAFPMEEGVSSINLAASVGIGLYMWRLHQ